MKVGRFARIGGNAMNVHVEQFTEQLGVFEPGLLTKLATRGFDPISIAIFKMPARLQPEVKLGMLDQRQGLASRVQHKSARGEVPRREKRTHERLMSRGAFEEFPYSCRILLQDAARKLARQKKALESAQPLSTALHRGAEGARPGAQEQPRFP